MYANKPKEKMRVVGYARYSTDKQDSNSIEYQKYAIEEYCAKHNIKLSKFYYDEAKSGMNISKRNNFKQLLKDAERGLFDAVIVYDISRGSRNMGNWFTFRDVMGELGIKVTTTKLQLGDTLDGDAFVHEAITAMMAHKEVLDTREKSIAGTAVLAKEGVFLGGKPPLGYDVPKGSGTYYINEEEAAVVRTIFKMYANGASYNQILDKLKGAKSKRGNPFGKNSFYSILNNERYTGVYKWNERIVKRLGKWAGGVPNPNMVRKENVIPRIIDDETWKKVQKRMKDNKRKGYNRAVRREYLLSGLIECGECGSNFIGKTNTNSKGYSTSYYVCGGKYRKRDCTCKNLNAQLVETYVVQAVKQYLSEIDFHSVARRIAFDINNASPDLSKEKKELANVTQKINNGVKAILQGMELDELEEELDRLKIRKSELEDIIKSKEEGITTVYPEDIVNYLQKSVQRIGEHKTKEVIQRHVTKIIAYQNGDFDVLVGVTDIGCGGRI